MDGTIGKQQLKIYISTIQPILHDFLDRELKKAREFGELQVEMLETFQKMIAAGKGIRGFLVKLGYEICGGSDLEKILDASTYIELCHSAILVQDDVMDRDDFRRGLPAAHKIFEKTGERFGVKVPYGHYGYSTAVCLSDVGIYLSWKKLLESDFSNEDKLRASEIYYRYIIRLAMGQVSDLTITGLEDISEEEVLKVIWTKSGEYTSLLPLMSGAALAGEKNPQKLQNIENFAKCLGWAFHIQDDILGLYAKQDELGKPVGSDLKEGKNTLLMTHLRKNGTPDQINFQRSLLGKDDIKPEDVEKMKQILVDSGSYKYVYDLGVNYINEGKQYIPLLTENKELQNVLESLLVYMMERVK